MFKSIFTSMLFIALVGCTTTPENNQKIDNQFGQINSNITESEQRLLQAIETHCLYSPERIEQVGEQLGSKVETALAKDAERQKPVFIQQQPVACEPVEVAEGKNSAMFENMIVMGETEKIYLIKEKLTFEARVDTGAVSSSLGVFNLTKFERDGDNWVRFTLNKDKESTSYEYPVLRMIKIVQREGSPADNRPVIELQFKLGEESYVSKFNLANRSHLEFQVLIGREFLRDIAIVNVSEKHLLGGK